MTIRRRYRMEPLPPEHDDTPDPEIESLRAELVAVRAALDNIIGAVDEEATQGELTACERAVRDIAAAAASPTGAAENV